MAKVVQPGVAVAGLTDRQKSVREQIIKDLHEKLQINKELNAEKETLESMLANSHSGFIHALDKAYAGVSISISYASMTTNIEYDFTTFKLEEGVIITIPCTYRG